MATPFADDHPAACSKTVAHTRRYLIIAENLKLAAYNRAGFPAVIEKGMGHPIHKHFHLRFRIAGFGQGNTASQVITSARAVSSILRLAITG